MKLGKTIPELLEASSLYKKIYSKGFEEGKQKKQITFGFIDKDTIVVAWDIGDIKERGSAIGIEVSTTEAREILDDILRNHDANYGINWDTIDMAIQEYRS